MKYVLLSILFIGYSLFMIIKPEKGAKLRHVLFIRNAEPTDFAIILERTFGVIFLIFGVIILFVSISDL